MWIIHIEIFIALDSPPITDSCVCVACECSVLYSAFPSVCFETDYTRQPIFPSSQKGGRFAGRQTSGNLSKQTAICFRSKTVHGLLLEQIFVKIYGFSSQKHGLEMSIARCYAINTP